MTIEQRCIHGRTLYEDCPPCMLDRHVGNTPSTPQFCRHCGAGVGVYRRPGEGTCEKCDPEGVEANRAKQRGHDSGGACE